jgi:hypothetical protein
MYSKICLIKVTNEIHIIIYQNIMNTSHEDLYEFQHISKVSTGIPNYSMKKLKKKETHPHTRAHSLNAVLY